MFRSSWHWCGKARWKFHRLRQVHPVAAGPAEVGSNEALVAVLLLALVAVNICNSSKAAATLVLDGCNTKLCLVSHAGIAAEANAPVS